MYIHLFSPHLDWRDRIVIVPKIINVDVFVILLYTCVCFSVSSIVRKL